MSSYASTPSPALGLKAPAVPARGAARKSFAGARGLAGLLLAAVVAAMVVLADQLINTWADGHLFLAWVLLWVVVFTGLALFAGTARSVACRAMAHLDGWSRSMAEARAERRLWEIAQNDPRVMQELMATHSRQGVEPAEPVDAGFDAALAPLGMETGTSASQEEARTPSLWARWVAFRGRQAPMYRYI